MSRRAFGEILANEAVLVAGGLMGPRDTKGYRLDEWIDRAVVGWDAPLRTYFLQYVDEGEDGETGWWFGTEYAELPRFADLCAVIRGIFGNVVEFEFVDRIQRDGCSE
jgi:hypothetical protein